mgnify:CR=1 FL=1
MKQNSKTNNKTTAVQDHPNINKNIHPPVVALLFIVIAYFLGRFVPTPFVAPPILRTIGFALTFIGFLFGIGAFIEKTLVAAGQATKVDPAASPEAAATPASEGRTEMIAPEDQVQFANDSTVLEPSAIAILDDVAAWVKADRSRTILVKGHADATGTVAYNLDLSSRRAETVASYLYGRGVAREQVAIVAVGEDAAVLAPATSNRRVVIYALSTGAATAAR